MDADFITIAHTSWEHLSQEVSLESSAAFACDLRVFAPMRLYAWPQACWCWSRYINGNGYPGFHWIRFASIQHEWLRES